jgi:hypothetical protein
MAKAWLLPSHAMLPFGTGVVLHKQQFTTTAHIKTGTRINALFSRMNAI